MIELYEVTTFCDKTGARVMGYHDLRNGDVDYRAEITARGRLNNGQDIQITSIVKLQADDLEAAFEELERDIQAHAKDLLDAAAAKMQQQHNRLIIPGQVDASTGLNGRLSK